MIIADQPDKDLMVRQLLNGSPGISPAWGRLLAEASVICLEYHQHKQGAQITISGTFSDKYCIYWDAETASEINASWSDEQELTEFGACGMAILLILALTNYTVIRRARKGTGVDYWLGLRDAEPPFQNAARLEISGILHGDARAVQARVNQKKRHSMRSDGEFPVYVVVIEFSQPVAQVVRR